VEATLATHAVCCRCLRAGKRRLHRYERRGDEALFMLEQRVARGLRDEEGRVHAGGLMKPNRMLRQWRTWPDGDQCSAPFLDRGCRSDVASAQALRACIGAWLATLRA
jgi:hypothetical protein